MAKQSSATGSCPYCKDKLEPRPKRAKNCPHCGNRIVVRAGKLYTEEQLDAREQKDWFKDSRKIVRDDVREEWKDERQFRREFGEAHTVGYVIRPGTACPHANRFAQLVVLVEDAFDTPEFLPPYEECRHDTCECEYDPVSRDEVPTSARIAEWDDPEMRARLKTRASAPEALRQKNKGGCASVIVTAIGLIGLCVFVAA